MRQSQQLKHNILKGEIVMVMEECHGKNYT